MSILPFDDRDGYIWMNGHIVEWREAKLHVLHHSLHYSGAVFEGIRSYNGKIFKMAEHNERLVLSAELIGYTLPYSVDELNAHTKAIVEKNGLKDAYIRPIAWRGAEQMGLGAQKNKVHVAIACWEWPNYFPAEILEKGLKMQIAKWRRPAPDTAPYRSKTSGLYTICTMSKHDAEAAGYHDALMLDYRGRVAEATGANFFMVKDGDIYTPIPDCFLNGITRQTAIQLAKDNGITVHETVIMPEDLAGADEVFVTGTAYEILPVGQIDDHVFGVGPIGTKLRKAYHELAGAKPS